MSASERPPTARFRDGGDDAPGGARDLLAAARRPRPMTAEQRARSVARVAAIAALPVGTAAGVASKWGGGKILALFGGLGVAGIALGVIFSGIFGERSRVEPTTVITSASVTGSASTSAVTSKSSSSSESTSASSSVGPAVGMASASSLAAPIAVGSGSGAMGTSAKGSTSAVPSIGDTLARETVLLEEARGLIAADPAAALAVCETHRKEFATGQLSAEREVLAIDALKRLGRGAQAKERGEAFIARNPKSFYVDRVRKLIEGL